VDIEALPFLLIISNHYFISSHSRYLFRKFSLSIIYINPFGNDLVLAFYTIVLICALASKTYIYLPIYLGRYLHNKFFGAVARDCVELCLEVFSFIYLFIFAKKNKKK
jgi:hypothetical protein